MRCADRIALLLDIVNFFRDCAITIVEAEVTTTANDGMASDIFLVQVFFFFHPRTLSFFYRDAAPLTATSCAITSPSRTDRTARR